MKNLILCFFLFSVNYCLSQNRTIEGRITNALGKSLENVEISNCSGIYKAVSDSNGFYAITIPDSVTVLIYQNQFLKSYQQNLTASSNKMDIEMEAKEFIEYFNEVSLEELMNMEITVASSKALTKNESPGIISVITEQEIAKSGARDILDVLRWVPGINFGVDVQGNVGIGMRGNWGHEGKVLMMIDGQEMTEYAYSTLQFGNHFSVDQIKRIEIIRGPGSSIYGGNAELGVINIITKQGSDLNGISFRGTYGQMQKNFARRNFNLMTGKKINDFEYSILGFIGEGNRSDQVFTDIYGNTFDLSKGGSVLNPTNLNVGLKYKDLSTRFIYDNLYCETSSLFDEGLPVDNSYHMSFESMMGEVKYEWKIGEKLKITPKFNIKYQEPWKSSHEAFLYNVHTRRIKGNVTGSYDLNEDVNFILGGEWYQDNAINKNETFFNEKNSFSYNNLSSFAQALIKTRWAIITVGGRLDKHSEIDPAFSPRIGLTKSMDKFHFKILYSYAFRTPGVENMNVAYEVTPDTAILIAPKIKPEKTKVFEIEMGYNIASNMLISANFFDIRINKPIIYFFSDKDGEGYFNDNKTGTRGLEFQYLIKDQWGYVNFNYSFYTSKGLNEVTAYSVPGKDNSLLAFPQHKFSITSNIKAFKRLNISPSLLVKGKRYTYRTLDADEIEVLSEEDPIWLLNLNLSYTNLFTKGLTIGFGVFDILNQKEAYLQPYNSWHAPWPSQSREYVFKISYDFKMN